jgi:hypothetical protein
LHYMDSLPMEIFHVVSKADYNSLTFMRDGSVPYAILYFQQHLRFQRRRFSLA